MIKIINHLYKPFSKENFLLYKFKYIIFETTDIPLIFILLKTRFLDPKKFDNIRCESFQYEKINNLENIALEKTLFISRYQIFWDQFMLENYSF
jgi:hypothetical protein